LLARCSRDPIQGTLGLSIAALVLLLANIFPFLQISLEGQVSESTTATGAIEMAR